MPELILHAGIGKTGTSMLQVLFARHAERLAQAGVVYPRGFLFDEAAVGFITSGNGVAMANYLRPELPHPIADKEAFIDELESELSRAGGKHVLYSSEFLQFVPSERSKTIAAVAAKYGYNPRVIYFVRNVDGRLFSVYSQKVKRHGEQRPFSQFLESFEITYRNVIEGACSVFGVGQVEVYNYDEKRRDLAGFFFRCLLGLDFTPPENPVVNRSLSGKEIELLRHANRLLGGDEARGTFVSDALMELATETVPEPMHLTMDEAALLEKRFGADVDFVNRLIKGRPIRTTETIVDRREEVSLTDFERAATAIIAKIIVNVVR